MNQHGVTTILPALLRKAGDAEVRGLLRAAESVLSQECGIPHELLIVDDGSDAELQSIPALRSLLSTPAVRVLRLARNQGIAYALNAGLTQARHDLIARIDADDFWRAGKLAKQVELLESDPDLTLVAASMRLVHPEDPSLDRDDVRGGGWPEALSLCGRIGSPFPHGSILARRDVFVALGGYPQDASFMHAEDFALWARWLRFFKVSILEDVLLEYTVAGEQISARFAEQQARAASVAYRMITDLGDIPEAVDRIARRLGLPLLEASKLLLRAWMFFDDIVVDPDLYDAARIVFPDRSVHRYDEVEQLLVDRFFYLRRGELTTG